MVVAEGAAYRAGHVSGTLWAKPARDGHTLSLKKAFFFALWLEAAILIGFATIDFGTHPPETEDRELIRIVPMEVPLEIEEKPPAVHPEAPRTISPPVPEPPPEPAPVVKKQNPATAPAKARQPPEETKPPMQQAAPTVAEAPSAAAESGGPATPADAPTGVPHGADEVSDPAATAAPAASSAAPPAALAGPRSSGALADRDACKAALLAGYPRDARRANQEGNLTALVTVDPDGRAAKIEITRANPRRVFDRALTRGLMSPACRFTPDPAGYRAIIPFEYRLDEE